jgi:acyl-[acyl-carrier-protein] desaturase
VANVLDPTNEELRTLLYRNFRAFFSKAEAKRRWSLERDIPWAEVNRNMEPGVAAVVESFCAVELFLPDYVAKALPMLRLNRGWSWFQFNWAYEESKHSLALGDWLLHSGLRTEEQMHDLQQEVYAHEWQLPMDSPSGMVIYGMTQELATWVNYKRLRQHVDRVGDPALSKVLQLITVDERAHHTYYAQMVKAFLELDRPSVIEQMRRVLHNFAMPAVYLMADSKQREAEIRALNVFTEEVYFDEVYFPILRTLGVTRAEMKGKAPKKSSPMANNV